MILNLDYYYGSEAEQYSFYRIPKMLFTDGHYKDMTVEAKVLYSLLLDRMSLSARNGWLDGERRVFIYFTLEDVMAQLNCGHNKAVKIFSDLEQIGLIERKKQGQGKPAKIYVKNFVIPMDPEQPPSETPPTPTMPETPPIPAFPSPSNDTSGMKTSQKAVPSEKGFSASPAKGSHDFPKPNGNNTEINNTEYNNTDLSFPPSPPETPSFMENERKGRMWMDEMDSYRELIRENIDYDLFLDEHPLDMELLDGYVELMAEVCCSQREYTRIGGERFPTAAVKGRFFKLNHEHIVYVLDSLKANTTLVRNIRAYTLTALYYAPVTMGQYYTSLVSHDMAQGGFEGMVQ